MSYPYTLRDVLDEIGMARDFDATADRYADAGKYGEAATFRRASERAAGRAQAMLAGFLDAIEAASAATEAEMQRAQERAVLCDALEAATLARLNPPHLN